MFQYSVMLGNAYLKFSLFLYRRYDLLLRCWLEEPGCRPNFTEIVRELNDVLEGMTTEVRLCEWLGNLKLE